MKTANQFYDSVEWQQLRLEKLAAAKGRCQACGRFDRRNNVHHQKAIRSAPDLALSYNNLVVLCPGHHEALHVVVRNRVLTLLVHVATDPKFLQSHRIDFGDVPKQFGLPWGEASANESFIEYERVKDEA